MRSRSPPGREAEEIVMVSRRFPITCNLPSLPPCKIHTLYMAEVSYREGCVHLFIQRVGRERVKKCIVVPVGESTTDRAAASTTRYVILLHDAPTRRQAAELTFSATLHVGLAVHFINVHFYLRTWFLLLLSEESPQGYVGHLDHLETHTRDIITHGVTTEPKDQNLVLRSRSSHKFVSPLALAAHSRSAFTRPRRPRHQLRHHNLPPAHASARRARRPRPSSHSAQCHTPRS